MAITTTYTSANNDGATITIAYPSSITAGNKLVVIISSQNGYVNMASDFSGWTVKADRVGGTEARVYIAEKTASGSEAGNVTINLWDDSGFTIPDSASAQAKLLNLGNTDSSTQINVDTTSTYATSTAPTFTPVNGWSGEETLYIALLAQGSGNEPPSAYGGWTEYFPHVANGLAAGSTLSAAYLLSTTSPQTPPTWTTPSEVCKTISIAVRPTTAAAVKKLKLLAHSSAASAASIAGVVYSAPTGDNITGSTKYGEFTGKSFESALESGLAVLKVPVADFGGDALTTSDTPVALVRNTTYTTGIVSCTVIEE